MKPSLSTLKSQGENRTSRSPSREFAKAAVLAASLALLPSACTTESHYYYTTVEVPRQGEEQPEEACPAPLASLSCRAPRINAVLEDGQNVRVRDRLVSFEGDSDFNGEVVMKVTDRACQPISQGSAQVGEPYAIEGAAEGVTLTVLDAEARSVEVEISLPLIVSGSLNQGESLPIPSTANRLQLDDLSTAPENEPPSALLSLLGTIGTEDVTLAHLDVQEGAAQPFDSGSGQISVGAPVVSPGYTFGAKRAEIEVFRCEE